MRRLRYSYHMQLTFELPVNEHHFKLRCFPSSDERQRISDERIEIYPAHFSTSERDSFGNMCIFGTASQTHERFSVDVEGTADVDITGQVPAVPSRTGIFKYETALTRAGESVREFHRSLDPMNWMTGYERAVYTRRELYEEFRYTPVEIGRAHV